MDDTRRIKVEVVFALKDRQHLVAVELGADTSAGDALLQSGIAAIFPEENLSACQLGIWGRLIEAGHALKDGDRLEIYRPLHIDPREARRRLATKGRSMGSRNSRTTDRNGVPDP
jgi:hypothetical protein